MAVATGLACFVAGCFMAYDNGYNNLGWAHALVTWALLAFGLACMDGMVF